MTVACKLSGSSEECNDGGIVTTGSSVTDTYQCGAQRENPTSCECRAANNDPLQVTVLDANTDLPLASKTVEIAGAMAVDTDINGEVLISLPVGSGTVIVTVTDSTGQYLDTSRTVDTSVSDSVTIYMFRKSQAVSVDTSVGTTLPISEDATQEDSPLQLEIPANSFYDADGNPVAGNVNVFLNYIPPDLGINDKAPGVFRAVDESGSLQALQTGGVFTVTAEDSSGNRLSSRGLPVTAGNNFKLFVLQPDQTWKLITSPTSRRRRQTSTYQFIGEVGISRTRLRWYNIDKFPENTRCWFKAQVFDTSTDELLNAGFFARFTAITLAYTNEPAVFPLNRYSYSSDACYEIRCDNPNTTRKPVGYIAIEVSFYTFANRFIYTTRRTDPYDILQYHSDVQTRLRELNFTKLLNVPEKPSIKIDLTAQDDGPFFRDPRSCESAGRNETDNVLKFEVPSLYQSSLDSENVTCVARVFHETAYGLRINSAFAASRWDPGHVYVDSVSVNPDPNSNGFILCLQYRCSTADNLTNVTITIDSYLRDYCSNATLVPPEISATGNGYFIDTTGNAGAAVAECVSDTSNNFALTINCTDNSSTDDYDYTGSTTTTWRSTTTTTLGSTTTTSFP